MSEQTEKPIEPVAKPRKAKAPVEAIIVAEPDVRLGSLGMSSPTEVVKHASELATALAEIINKQGLFSLIKDKKSQQKKKYVRCEGWTTMGAMLGVFPVEDYCRPLPNGKGFEAKVNLVRSKDGMVIGSASAECTTDESNWSGKDSYSLRSMSLTRATSKAFRLSFSWIIKLAGFEPTPAEEMQGQEDASVIREQVEAEVEKQKAGAQPSKGPDQLCVLPLSDNLFEVKGDPAVMNAHKELLLASGKRRGDAVLMDAEQLNVFSHEFCDNRGGILVPLKAA